MTTQPQVHQGKQANQQSWQLVQERDQVPRRSKLREGISRRHRPVHALVRKSRLEVMLSFVDQGSWVEALDHHPTQEENRPHHPSETHVARRG